VQEPSGTFSTYIKESKAATFTSFVALLGGSAATVLKNLGIERPMPVWLAWAVCLVILVVSQYWIYAKLYQRHREYLQEARSAARLPPAIRGRILRIKEIVGQLSAGLRGLSRLDRETTDALQQELRTLAGQVGEHLGLSANVNFYAGFVSTLLNSLDEAPDEESKRRAMALHIKDEHEHFKILMYSCNMILDKYPPPSLSEP